MTASPADRPAWGVVAQVREPVELLVPFAAWHLAAGARLVRLYFDDPADPAAEALAAMPGVEIVRCDAAHWRRAGPFGQRPTLKVKRQIANIRHARRMAARHGGPDWLAHLDADEFLHLPSGIGADLARLTGRHDWLRLPVVERVWASEIDRAHLFGGAFRRQLIGGPAVVDKIYGRGNEFLYPRGMAGHFLGKPLFATRPRSWPRNHEVRTSPLPVKILPHVDAKDAILLHFEGLTPRHWALKQLRQSLLILDGKKPMRDARRRVTQDILAAPDPLASALDWFRKTYLLPPRVTARLEARGALSHPEVAAGIEAATAALAPELGLDLSFAAIDDRIEDDLQRTLAEVLRRRG